jgi:hypothetical protein
LLPRDFLNSTYVFVVYRVALDEAEELNITLQQELDKLHLQWHDAQNNYERQVRYTSGSCCSCFTDGE